MSKAAELAALIGSQSSLSNRNLIINGAMQVAQRGTSSTGITSGQYHTVDRQKLEVNTTGTWTATQSTTAPTDFVNSLKYDCTVADASLASSTDYVFHAYYIEGQDLQHLNYGTSSAKKTTVSFYVRSNKTGTYTFEYQMYDGSNYYRNGKTYTINSADTWEYKTITIDGNTSNSIVNSTAAGLTLIWWLAAGTAFTSGTFNNGTWTGNNAERVANTVNLADSTSNEWLITGIQLEVGEQATPFEHRSYGDELRRCQRYYYRHADGGDTSTASVGTGAMYSSSALMCAVSFPVRMRATPTLDHLNSSSAYRFWRSASSDYFDNFNAFYDAHPLGGAMQADNNISGTAGDGGRVVLGGSAAYIAFDAEL